MRRRSSITGRLPLLQPRRPGTASGSADVAAGFPHSGRSSYICCSWADWRPFNAPPSPDEPTRFTAAAEGSSRGRSGYTAKAPSAGSQPSFFASEWKRNHAACNASAHTAAPDSDGRHSSYHAASAAQYAAAFRTE